MRVSVNCIVGSIFWSLVSCTSGGRSVAPPAKANATVTEANPGNNSHAATSTDSGIDSCTGAAANSNQCVGQGPLVKKVNGRNVTGASLAPCPSRFTTGFERTGFCNTGPDDAGVHVVCAAVTAEFLQFSKRQGNDLISAQGSFPGLSPGDAWCLCASRWKQALDAGVAPPVFLQATDATALNFVTMQDLQSHQTQP
jgi:uncharacterized protein